MISIIIATYNSAKTVQRSLESLYTQTSNEFELVIVDGKSKDETVSICTLYQQKFIEKGITFKLFSEPDEGIYDAFNKGVEHAAGEWLTFLGSDDWIIDDLVIEKCIAELQLLSDVDWVCTGFLYPEESSKKNIEFPTTFDWKRFRYYMNLPHPGSFHHQSYFAEVGYFDTTFKIAGDYEILLRKREKLNVKCLNFHSIYMSSTGISNRQVKNTLLETYKAQVKNKVGGSIFYGWSAFRLIMSYLKRKIIEFG